MNQFILTSPFSLDNHMTLARLLTPPAYLASLNIAEAYTHIPMRPNIRRYLAFSYLRQLYFFHALPFGLNVAPFIFTQVLAWPIQCLRDRGISLLAYLDDIVIWHRDRDTLSSQVHHVMWFLQDMGIRFNLAKSLPYATDSTVWLGIRWFPQTGYWQLPSEGQLNIRTLVLDLLRAPWVTRRQLEHLVRVINFACQVHRFLRPFLQPLTAVGLVASAADRDVCVRLLQVLRAPLRFWASLEPWQHVLSFHVSFPLRFHWMDASAHGWGALLELSHMGSGHWSPLERHFHVNVLELQAVCMAVSFFDFWRLVLRVFTDNETVRFTLAACSTRSSAAS